MSTRPGAAATLLVTLSSVSLGTFAGTQGAPQVLAAFVVLGQSATGETVPMARVVVDGADAPCPALEGPQGQANRPTSPRRNPDPANFGVTVCEALYPRSGRLGVAGTAIQLPEIAAATKRIVLFGDTGCKPADQDGCHVDSARHWPFQRMADAAANSAPNLVLHVGDYNYRGTPGRIRVNGTRQAVYDAGDNTSSLSCKLTGPYVGQNSQGSDSPDQWGNWQADFFQPAARLLQAAPWVFSRGNHELCSRAGPGWFYLLDPGSDLLGPGQGQLACPAADSSEPLVFRPPYRVDLDGLSLVSLDSANACDQGSLHQGHFDRQFAQIPTLVGQAPAGNAVWLQTHRPLWAVKKPWGDTAPQDLDPSGQYAFIDHTLQTAYARHPLPRPVQVVASGHMHRFQVVSFPASGERQRPVQLVVGNGGVARAGNHPKAPFSLDIDGMTGVGFGLSKFGYMDIALGEGGHWSGRLLDRKGRAIARCDSADQTTTGVCAPVGK